MAAIITNWKWAYYYDPSSEDLQSGDPLFNNILNFVSI